MGEPSAQFEPKTLVEATRFFSDPATCVKYLAERRPDGPVCPKCGGKQHSYLSTRFLWKCKECKKQFSVKVGTIFMTHRIRYAMQTGSFNKACGQVEVDETFTGQNARNMHECIRPRKVTDTGGKHKTMVVGVMERGGVVRTTVVESRKKKPLRLSLRAITGRRLTYKELKTSHTCR